MRIIDAGMNIAGPCAATVLANLGADVIKVESPQGDRARAYTPTMDGIGTLFATMNQNKRYIGLDLTTADGRDVLDHLVARSDALIHNLRPGKDAALGLAPDRCHASNPRLVHCAIEAFYPEERERPGYDLLIQAESGILDPAGGAGGGPCRLPGSIIDEVAGLWAANGVLAALQGERERATLVVTLMDVAMWLLGDKVSAWLAGGSQPTRLGSQLSTTTPHGAYRAADGWLVIGAATDAMFARLASVLGSPLTEPRFISQAARIEHRDELTTASDRAASGGSRRRDMVRTAAGGRRSGGTCSSAPGSGFTAHHIEPDGHRRGRLLRSKGGCPARRALWGAGHHRHTGRDRGPRHSFRPRRTGIR